MKILSGVSLFFLFPHFHTPRRKFLPLAERKFVFLSISTALTTCRDGWLGFPFRWRTQQSAISGINCRISITESLNAKGAREKSPVDHPRACRILSVEKIKNQTQKSWTGREFSRVHPGDCPSIPANFIVRQRLATNSNTKNQWVKSFLFIMCTYLFTDLSAAGPPAELKHITQRRKRKQPWFP